MSPALLFEPMTLRGLSLSNRIWVAPMCQYSCSDGMVGDWHLAHLGALANGRAGLIMTEAAAIVPEGRISPADAGIWNDAQSEAWARVVGFAHSQGVPIGIQLAHAGRKASTMIPWEGSGSVPAGPGSDGWTPRAPSPLAYPGLAEPSPLSLEEAAGLAGLFADAAGRAVEAGFDLIEVHGAHGYLLHQFFSPETNRRDDAYGGAGRDRALLEAAEAVRAAIPDATPLVVRVSATDWTPDGLTVADVGAICAKLADLGVDLVSVSSGGNSEAQDIPVGSGYHVPLARAVREASGLPVGVAGLITSPQQAETILVDGAADAVYIGRQFLREPGFALRAAAELGADVEWPPQHVRGKPGC